MGPLAGQLLLESLLAPGLLAALVMLLARGSGYGPLAPFAPVLAIALAIGTTYVLAFGWPPGPAVGARAKILLSAVIGLAVGVAIQGRIRWYRFGFITAAIGIPIWIGLPALQQMNLESVLLILPVTAALAVLPIIGKTAPSASSPQILILLTLTVSLAAIAVFAKTFSFAELGLSLGSALLAILTIDRKPLAAPAVIMAAAMLSALITALLLYSEVSLPALLVLAFVIGADRLARLWTGGRKAHPSIWLVLVFCILPAAAAILIARIDAGAISIY
ncbi:MAG: hypothetical protein ACR2P3_04315 [Geminicoccaceae bacterium]